MTRSHPESQSPPPADHIALQLEHDALRQRYDALVAVTRRKRSPNHPDPPTFTDGVDPTWRTWKAKVHDKMVANKDHFETSQVEATTVISWTAGKAGEHIQAVRNLDIDHFKDHQQVVEFLGSIYDDPDYKRNTRIKFRALTMGIQDDFQSFFSTFLLLSSQTDYNEAQKIEELLEKLSLPLRKALSVYPRQFDTLVEARIVLTQMYNSQERIRKEKAEKRAAQQQPSDFTYATASAIPASIPSTKPTIHSHQHIEPQSRSRNPVTDTLATTGKCFTCGELGHTWKLCPNAEKYKKRQWHDLQVVQMNLNVESSDSDSMRISSTRDDSMFDPFANSMFDPFAKRPLVTSCTLSFGSNQHRLEALIDTGATGYAFIDRQIAQLVCDMLHMEPVPLLKPKPLTGFDGRHAPPITHAIYPKLTIGLHSELTAPLLITDLGNHPIILGKPWMNKHGVILDMAYDKLIFKPSRCSHHGSIPSQVVKARRLEAPASEAPASDRRWDVPNWRHDAVLSKESNAEHTATAGPRYTILPRPKPKSPAPYLQDESDSLNSELSTDSETECDVRPPVTEQDPSEVDTTAAAKATSSKKRDLKKQRNQRWKVRKQQQSELAPLPGLDPDDSVDIAVVGAASFCLLAGPKGQKQGVECFSITISQIDSVIKALQVNPESLEANAITKEILEHEQVKPILERLMERVPKYFHDLSEVFSPQEVTKLPPHQFYDHKIELLSDASFLPRSRIHPLSLHKLQKLKEYLEDNLQKGFIAPSKAAFASPVLFAVKPNGQLRLCVDYRRLNQLTKRSRYPIPLIGETLARVQGCKYLTKLEIVSSLNKLRMSPESEELTTFVTSMGAYKYRVLPFGLTNGQASWQHYVNDLLFGFLNNFCQAALDDILIYSKSKKEHIVHVRAILERLKEIGLQVDIEKCEFFKKEVAFLGVLLSADGLRMNSKNIEVIVNWERPTNLKEVQAFVDFVKFYRRFIRDFSKKAETLTRMTKKLVRFEWTAETEEAFNLLKKTVTEAPILRHYDRTKQAVLETDSSNYVNAGVLSQYDDEGVLHPVAFYSRNLIPAECNYEIYDKELLAIIRCLEHWRPELEGTDEPIKILTDHKGLETFMSSKKLTPRQARWAEILSEFNIAIQFQSGAQNVKADALTRMPGSRPKNDNDERHQYREQVLLTPERLEIHSVGSDEPIYERVLAANKADDDCKAYREALEQGLTSMDGVNLRDCHARDGALYRGDRLWVPADVPLLIDLLREIHEHPASEHPGFNRMEDLLKRNYYWPHMRKAIRQYVRNCHGCQRSKASRQNDLLTPLAIPIRRWEDISMDFITGLPNAHGYNSICTIIDRLSIERHYVPCTAENESTSVEAAARILVQYVFRTHGLPSSITSNRGPQFISLVWQAFCRILRIKCKLSTASHSETDGQTERVNEDIERQLRQYCNYMQDDWDTWIPMAEFADNNAPSTTTGLSPFFVNKGFHPRMSFSPDPASYTTTRERLLAAKAEDITGTMRNILNYVRDHAAVDNFHQKRPTVVSSEPTKPPTTADPEPTEPITETPQAADGQDPPPGRRRSRRKAAALALIESTFG